MARILLVEDNEMNLDMLSRRLRRAGYELVVATDGAQAILKAQTEAPDLILMDLGLPVMDGWEAARQLKSDPDTQTIPIIALTAHVLAGTRESAMEVGCNDFDTKPIDLVRLLAKIEVALSQAI